MNEQPIDLKAALTALWRRRIAICLFALAGLLGGLAYGFARPPMPSAIALVLLPPSSLTASGTPTIDMSTQVVIATSTPVLSAAGTSVSPPVSPIQLSVRRLSRRSAKMCFKSRFVRPGGLTPSVSRTR